MKGTGFKKIIVLGSWKIAEGVLNILVNNKNLIINELLYINNGLDRYDYAEKCAEREGIEHIRIENAERLTEYFSQVSDKALIVSAGNYYLFPEEIVNRDNITIINAHNSLLPDYPGRNAPTWAIYYGEKETGITWHYVSFGIDDGAIICQERCNIHSDSKAYQIAAIQMEMAVNAFEKCIESVLEESCIPVFQPRNTDRKVYFSNEMPQNGEFSLTDDADAIYRLLRSVDYGKSPVFPAVHFMYQGIMRRVKRYSIVDDDNTLPIPWALFLQMRDGRFVKIRYDNAR